MDYAAKVPKDERFRLGENRWWVHMRRKVLMRLAFKYKHMLTDTHFLTDTDQDNEVEK